MARHHPLAGFLTATLAACANAPLTPPGSGHLSAADVAPAAGSIPAPVQNTLVLPPPKAAPAIETYSVVVNNVRAQELLFALARDAKLNIDVHPGINGVVTLNAIDQTLPQILTRIARQTDMRWELDGPNLAVMPDTPFLRTYQVDYVNMARDTSGAVTVTTQIAATGAAGTDGSAAGSGAGGGNNSLTKIENKAQHRFWETLDRNLKDLLRETDKILPAGSSETVVEHEDQEATTATGAAPQLPIRTSRGAAAPRNNIAYSPTSASVQQSGTTVVRRTTFREAAAVIVNPEAGIVSVRATSHQHEKVQEFIDQVSASAHRQVLIEATIAEVTLSERYQQGVNWQSLRSLRPGARSAGVSVAQNPTGLDASGQVPNPFASAGTAFLLNYAAPGLGISATLSLLETFGKVKVISSPKLSVINNQTAVLKVVDNLVYFTVRADTTSNQTTTTTTYTTNLYSVPVGLVMNVTPQIGGNDSVLLNLRPSISRQYDSIEDPNPDLQRLSIHNKIPVIRTREMESMIRVDSGNIVVMGGLMEDGANNAVNAMPGLAALPLLGNLFSNRDETRNKTELVIFLRPLVIKEASLGGDYGRYRSQLPGPDFFDTAPLAADDSAGPAP
ncbi:MAG: pilus (MSHA type) biogenesis protein MshL [Rhodocyclaceae bacterium]|nr:pilus (MSHA type) biogenesis protein MshL [Rhodocyclaceae bacterium]